MKKFFLTLLICIMSVSLSFAGVFVTPNGKKYHEEKDCSKLSRSKVIKEVEISTAKTDDYTPCATCYPDTKNKKQTKKEQKPKTNSVKKDNNAKKDTKAKSQTDKQAKKEK